MNNINQVIGCQNDRAPSYDLLSGLCIRSVFLFENLNISEGKLYRSCA